MTSAINPNNIDGAYPVAGQDNNSQGFRDNFTNTKVNFQYAANEITELQAKAVLKSALSGSTLDNNMLGAIISQAQIQGFTTTRVALGTLAGTVTLNYNAGHYQTVTTNGPISLAFTNLPVAGLTALIRLQVTIASTAHTLTLPAAVSLGILGIEGISPGTSGVSNTITFAQTGTYEFEFVTSNNGTTITVFDLNRPLSYYTNPVSIVAATTSTSTSTGALIVSGGVGIAGNLYVGGTIGGSGSTTTTGNITAGNLIATSSVQSVAVDATGNVSAANVVSTGVVSSVVVSTGNLAVSGVAVYSGSEDLAASAAANTQLSTSYFTTAAAETATLAAGTNGQVKVFAAVDITAGNMVITVTNAGWKASGTGTITFDTRGDACTLQYINSKWFCTGNNGCVFA
jgi:hypothetical protein